MKKDQISQLLSALLVMLWLYAAVTKLINYQHSQQQMAAQIFPKAMSSILTWLIPAIELSIAGMLIYNPSRKTGLKASFTLLMLFSAYISLSMSGLFGRVPCSCGGIFSRMSYWQHLNFNLLFAAIALLCIYLDQNIHQTERRPAKT